MSLTAREIARQQKQARKERERDARRADRERLRRLRENIRRARHHAGERLRAVVRLCRQGRKRLRQVAKEIRARKRAEAQAEIAQARVQTRSACEARKAQARAQGTDSLQRAGAKLAGEREHQALLKLWAQAPKLAGGKPSRGRRAAELAAESDDEVIGNIPPELVPVFRRVKHRIKSSPRRTRTEAFLEWAQEHPADVTAIVDEKIHADVARMVAEERQLRRDVVRPSTYRRASDAELLQRYEAYQGAPEVPF